MKKRRILGGRQEEKPVGMVHLQRSSKRKETNSMIGPNVDDDKKLN